jgi:predicted nucleotidyltransferase
VEAASAAVGAEAADSAVSAAAIRAAEEHPAAGSSGPHTYMDELKELVAKLDFTYHDRLVSVVLYGSGASGNHNPNFSDLNVLCVLKEIGPRELGEGEPVMRWWRERGHPSPLLMTEEEAHNSTDSFPIEFRDMQDHRKVLHGIDVIAHLHVDTKNYRTQIEHELRAKLFRLRQQGAQVLSDPAKLLKLCVDSVPTFCMLGRHALLAGGIEVATGRRDVVRKLQEKLGPPPGPFDVLLDLREDKAGVDAGDAVDVFAQYLEFIRRMVEYVDRMEDRK